MRGRQTRRSNSSRIFLLSSRPSSSSSRTSLIFCFCCFFLGPTIDFARFYLNPRAHFFLFFFFFLPSFHPHHTATLRVAILCVSPFPFLFHRFFLFFFSFLSLFFCFLFFFLPRSLPLRFFVSSRTLSPSARRRHDGRLTTTADVRSFSGFCPPVYPDWPPQPRRSLRFDQVHPLRQLPSRWCASFNEIGWGTGQR